MAFNQDHLDQYMLAAESMAQDLREYADAAEEAGSPIEETEQILNEFDVISNVMNGFGGK